MTTDYNSMHAIILVCELSHLVSCYHTLSISRLTMQLFSRIEFALALILLMLELLEFSLATTYSRRDARKLFLS